MAGPFCCPLLAYLGDVHLQCAARADIEEPLRFHIRSSSASVGSMDTTPKTAYAATLTNEQAELALDAVESMMIHTYDREILRQLHNLALALGADYEPFDEDDDA